MENEKLKINTKDFFQKENIYLYFYGIIFNLDYLKTKYKIKSDKDVNILYDLYIQQNLDFIMELKGNFNIIIYDKIRNKIYLINDKLGSFPLYYYIHDSQFIFSDSLKSMMKLDCYPKIIDKQSLSNYLGYMYIPAPYTIFKDTFKLEKGSILIYDFHEYQIKKYFSLEEEYRKAKKKKKYEKELITDFSNLFKNSVECLGDKNSQVGVFLSSGKDSTLLAKLASNYYNKQINTYTLAFQNEKDESKEAQKIANYLQSNHHTILLEDSKIKLVIKKLSKMYDEPFADPSIIPTTYMIDSIPDKNDFYISGEGCDAIFLANNMYRIHDLKGRIKLSIKKLINIIWGKRVYHNFSEMSQINIISRFNYSDKLLNIKGQVYDLPKINNKRFRASMGDLNNTISEKYRIKNLGPMKYHNYCYYSPYYQEDIILKSFSILPKQIYKKGRGKIIFDKVLFQHIPQEYFDDYTKKGFGIPIIDWVKRFMLDEIKILSKKDFIKKQNIFCYDALINLFNEFEQRPNYNIAVVLWNYYIFQLWYIENVGEIL